MKQELQWAIEREKELKRTFILPILLEEISPENMPTEFSTRLYLRLNDSAVRRLRHWRTERHYSCFVWLSKVSQLSSSKYRVAIRSTQSAMGLVQGRLGCSGT